MFYLQYWIECAHHLSALSLHVLSNTGRQSVIKMLNSHHIWSVGCPDVLICICSHLFLCNLCQCTGWSLHMFIRGSLLRRCVLPLAGVHRTGNTNERVEYLWGDGLQGHCLSPLEGAWSYGHFFMMHECVTAWRVCSIS